MGFPLALLVFALVASASYSADNEPGETRIRNLLLAKQSWTMYLEYTDRSAPSDKANKFVWEYFERDGKVFARRRGLIFGGCDSELSVRADGFSFRWCDPQLNAGEGPSLIYDPSNSKYPFKSREPRKLWLQAND